MILPLAWLRPDSLGSYFSMDRPTTALARLFTPCQLHTRMGREPVCARTLGAALGAPLREPMICDV